MSVAHGWPRSPGGLSLPTFWVPFVLVKHLPHVGHRVEFLKATPQSFGARFAIAFPGKKPSQLSDPAHRLPYARNRFGGCGSPIHVGAKGLPLCIGQPV